MKKSKKTNEQLDEEIKNLVIKRYGEGSSFLLIASEGKSCYTNFLSNNSQFFFMYGSIMLGEFCKVSLEGLNNVKQSQ